MDVKTRKVIIDIIQILVCLINLGEQFGVYALQTVDTVNDAYQRSFFFILFFIDGIDVFQCVFKSEWKTAVISMIVDILELILYVTILHRTAALYAVAFSTYFVELFLNGVVLCIQLRDAESSNPCSSLSSEVWDRFWLFAFRAMAYLLLQLPQILFLFLRPESKFLETYYEVLAIFSLYCGGISYNYLEIFWRYVFEKDHKCNAEAIDKVTKNVLGHEVSDIAKGWFLFTVAVSALLGVFIFPITTFVLAGTELRYNSDTMPNYNRSVCIYFIVSNVMWYLSLIAVPIIFLVKEKCKCC